MTQQDERSLGYSATMEIFRSIGWKKFSFFIYNLAKNSDHIMSINLKKTNKTNNIENVTIELHSIRLNQISHFMWDYGKKYYGEYKAPNLKIRDNLNNYKACSLFATQVSLAPKGQNLEDYVDACVKESENISERFPDTDSLISLYKDLNHFVGPLLCMLLDKKDYFSARELLNDSGFNDQSGAGDVRFGVYHYLRDNKLA